MGSITAVKSLLEKGHLSQDCVLLVDEMYLQKGTQFHGGEYIGANENDELYKGIMIFMITALKKRKKKKQYRQSWSNSKWWVAFSRNPKMYFSTDKFWIFD